MRSFASETLLNPDWATTGRGGNSSSRSAVARRLVKRLRFPQLGIAALLAFAPAVAARNASSRPLPRRAAASAPAYNLAAEVTVQGAIQSVVRQATPGLMYGGHLMVRTPQGTVDAQVGKFLLRGRKSPSFTTGEQVLLVGTMTTFRNRNVLLVRLIQTSSGTITVRDVRGALIVPFGKKAARGTSNAGGAL